MVSNNEAINLLGEFMLKGWVLTDVPCSCGMITVRKKDHSVVEYCVVCSAKNTPNTATVSTAETPTEYSKESFEEQQAKGEKISKKLGELLLKGYKMLDICCATHLDVPLMQKETDICVECELFPEVETLIVDKIASKDLQLKEPVEESILLQQIISEKIALLSQLLRDAYDPNTISDICRSIKCCMELLKDLK